MIAEIGLGLSVVASGLWSGLLLTLTTILHPMYAARDGKGFAEDMRRFLPVARRSPTNYVLVVALLIAPIVALVGLWQQKSGAPFILTAIGLAANIAGPLLTSRYLAEPNYDVILSWDPNAVPSNWIGRRDHYFQLNWVRAILTWIAFALFVAASYLYFT